MPELYVTTYGKLNSQKPIIRLRIIGNYPDGSSRHLGKIGELVFSPVAGAFSNQSRGEFHETSNLRLTELARNLKLDEQSLNRLAERI